MLYMTSRGPSTKKNNVLSENRSKKSRETKGKKRYIRRYNVTYAAMCEYAR